MASKLNKRATQDAATPETKEQLRTRLGEPLTTSVPDAGWKYYGIGRNASYDAARTGQIPTIRVGKRLRVPIMAMERKLEETLG